LTIAMTAALAINFGARAAEIKAPLYQRLGGMPAIRAVADDLLNRIAEDARINAWFAWAANPERAAAYKTNLADFICQATGGPCQYQGKGIPATHRGMGITKTEFDSMVEDVAATLDKLQVPETEKNELLGMLAPLKPMIVER